MGRRLYFAGPFPVAEGLFTLKSSAAHLAIKAIDLACARRRSIPTQRRSLSSESGLAGRRIYSAGPFPAAAPPFTLSFSAAHLAIRAE